MDTFCISCVDTISPSIPMAMDERKNSPSLLDRTFCPHCGNLDWRSAELDVNPRLCKRSVFRKTSENCRFCGLIYKASSLLINPNGQEVKPFESFTLSLYQKCPPRLQADEDLLFFEVSIFGAVPDVLTWGILPYLPPLPQDPASDRTFSFVRRQIEDCSLHHDECRIRRATTAPKRLLSVSADNGRIRLARSDTHSREKYATLSYCWGGDQGLKLTKADEVFFQEHIEWGQLTPLHQDAVTLCRRLDIPFLWIDAFCICQDDMDDWREESAHMADIYENACITIFAAACSSPRDSFLIPHTCVQKELVQEDGASSSPLVLARRRLLYGLHCTESAFVDPLERRAWAFQEFQLPRRILIYTSEEVQWSCRMTTACECADDYGHVDPRNSLYRGRLNSDRMEIFSLWRDMVARYSECSMTHQRDKLVALSGLASRIGEMLESPYLAGLWKVNLIHDLLWKMDRSFSGLQPSPQAYRAPTWSLASVNGRIEWLSSTTSEPTREILVALEEVNCTPKGGQTYGEVSDGYLRVTGRLVAGTLDIGGDNRHALQILTPFGFAANERFLNFAFDTILTNTKIQQESGQLFYTACRSKTTSPQSFSSAHVNCLPVLRDSTEWQHILLLAQSARRPGFYERIGLAWCDVGYMEFNKYVDGLPWQSITII
ncbi:HET-domain-containing protein [Rhizodiscina lignyota]|uniref:HET-domain-containing protein n=1 Tax=Rhizodiscina lignyota TaxID=1504668 RepID=A0A9P4ICP3_9PEZI|nr:HET-domain-containing protein [Rhizodiscina lignyota]